MNRWTTEERRRGGGSKLHPLRRCVKFNTTKSPQGGAVKPAHGKNVLACRLSDDRLALIKKRTEERKKERCQCRVSIRLWSPVGPQHDGVSACVRGRESD
ncbi:hypothetical protein MATL_G00154260 [Megalops atlanticus]|uniref:Uncharacterized protein n=1 Tax=Megalops atlanticus TaxID=7932 RepID=A0A9D3TAB5_MEGAT|nr:hypothetical protein MATL_G00154260 [Megalops atlanticus]